MVTSRVARRLCRPSSNLKKSNPNQSQLWNDDTSMDWYGSFQDFKTHIDPLWIVFQTSQVPRINLPKYGQHGSSIVVFQLWQDQCGRIWHHLSQERSTLRTWAHGDSRNGHLDANGASSLCCLRSGLYDRPLVLAYVIVLYCISPMTYLSYPCTCWLTPSWRLYTCLHLLARSGMSLSILYIYTPVDVGYTNGDVYICFFFCCSAAGKLLYSSSLVPYAKRNMGTHSSLAQSLPPYRYSVYTLFTYIINIHVHRFDATCSTSYSSSSCTDLV